MNHILIKYRKATLADIEYLLWLRKETMTEYLLKSGMDISEERHLARIKDQFEYARIILLDNEKIGFLKVKDHIDKIEILQIQIEPKYQNKGYGQKIINSIFERAKENNLLVSLSVLKCNKAQQLYRRMGFEIVMEDDNSYIMQH
jgi:ribosomal protein S18 acetylase RimI-like enzyme